MLLGGSLFCAASPLAAQTWTAAVWAPYTDRFGLIHSVPVQEPNRDPSTGNGLLYTAEACVIMQLSNVSYDRDKIVVGVKASQVKPGLFRRSPPDLKAQEGPDDYVGLGALAGVCGFHDIARDILSYGTGGDQPSGPTVLGSNDLNFEKISDKIKQCKTVPYNYNNVDPGKFTLSSWMGRFPANITHWKIAAGERPSPDELGVWAAALIFSGKRNSPDQDHWLQSWLMVLTYQLSQYHSAAADYAVVEWWKMLHARYPNGGIKQAMTDYLGTGAKGNPLAEYIDNFEQSHNPNTTMVDSSTDVEGQLGPVANILSNNCGTAGQAACIDYNDFSPANFMAPLTMGLTASSNALSGATQALAVQQRLVDAQAAAVKQANDALSGLNKTISDLQARHTQLQQQISGSVLQKASMIAKGLDKIPLPGHWVTPTKKVLGHTIPIGPPFFVPGGTRGNPDFDALVNSIANLENRANDALNKIGQAQSQLQSAQQNLLDNANAFAALKPELDRLQGELTKAKAVLEAAKGSLQFGQAVAQRLIPCADNVVPGH